MKVVYVRLHLSAARRVRLCRDQMWRPVRLLVLELHHLLELVDGLAVAQPRGGRPWCASLQRAVCVHVLGWGVRQSEPARRSRRPSSDVHGRQQIFDAEGGGWSPSRLAGKSERVRLHRSSRDPTPVSQKSVFGGVGASQVMWNRPAQRSHGGRGPVPFYPSHSRMCPFLSIYLSHIRAEPPPSASHNERFPLFPSTALSRRLLLSPPSSKPQVRVPPRP